VGSPHLALVAGGAAVLATSAVLAVVTSGDVATWAARVTSIALAVVAVLLAVAARLWRFTSRARRRDVLVVFAMDVVALVGVPCLATSAPVLASTLVLATAAPAIVELVAITRRVTRSEDLDVAHRE
jgi:cytochrome bd-type quinol oxidase subunit 2